MALALVVGLLAALGHDRTTFVVALALPMAILLFRYPWTAVLLFLAIQPLIVVGGTAWPAPENWAVGRLLVPMVLALALAYRMLGLSRSYFRLSVTDFAIAAFVVVAFANIQLLSGNPVRMTMAFYDHIVIPITPLLAHPRHRAQGGRAAMAAVGAGRRGRAGVRRRRAELGGAISRSPASGWDAPASGRSARWGARRRTPPR